MSFRRVICAQFTYLINPGVQSVKFIFVLSGFFRIFLMWVISKKRNTYVYRQEKYINRRSYFNKSNPSIFKCPFPSSNINKTSDHWLFYCERHTNKTNKTKLIQTESVFRERERLYRTLHVGLRLLLSCSIIKTTTSSKTGIPFLNCCS